MFGLINESHHTRHRDRDACIAQYSFEVLHLDYHYYLICNMTIPLE